MDDTRTATTGPAAPAAPGMFQTEDGAVYRVVTSQAGRLYAKRLNNAGGFEYAAGAIKRITEDDRMTLEAAQAFGRRFGVCVKCGRLLTDPASIGNGIGPICAKGEDGYWSAAERSAAKVAMNWDEIEAERKAAAADLVAANAVAVPEPKPEPKPVLAGVLTISGAKATLVSEYDPDAVAAARAIPGRKWDGSRKVNVFPVNGATTLKLVELCERFGYKIEGDGLPDVAELFATAEANEAASRATDAEIEIEGLHGELLPFQRAGVAYAAANGSVLIGDEMGLGKTVQAIATLQARDAFPALVVVPATMKPVWQRHFESWLPGRRVAVLAGRNGNAEALDTYDVVVVNYDILSARLEELGAVKWKALVADESHYLKNAKAKRTKALRTLARKIDLRLLLTGTPVLNRPVELISQLDVLGHLEDFGGFWNFAKRYCAAVNTGYGWDLTGASHLDELHDLLRKTCYIRRTKDQVLTELPPKRRATVPLPLSDRGAYERATRDLREFFEMKLEADAEFQALLADLDAEDAGAATAAEIERRERSSRQAEILTRINALRQLTALLKIDAATDWIVDFTASGAKLVVFAHHREIVKAIEAALAKAGVRSVSVTGETPMGVREAAVDAFQTEDDVKVFIGTIGAAGVGITLTAASDVAFVELPWRPGDVDQAEDRCHRIGQNDSVTVWYLLAEKTMDETMADLLDEKRAVVEAATDGRTVATTSVMAGLLASLSKQGEEDAA